MCKEETIDGYTFELTDVMEEDNTIQLLKDILALHGLPQYGGDIGNGLVERGVYYTGKDGDLNRKYANHVDGKLMNEIDDRIINILNKDEDS
jgi:hypothetical protein